MLLFVSMAAGFTGTSTFSVITPEGAALETAAGEYTAVPAPAPVYDPPEILWHFSDAASMTQKVCPIGNGASYVLTGGWYGGAIMFDGVTGDGTTLWTYEPASWTGLGTGTAAAEGLDVFYAVQNWDPVDGANTAVHCFAGGSATPVWTYTDASFNSGGVDTPGKYACSEDGSVFAVGGAIDGHLAIQFFEPGSSTPISTYQDEALAYYPRQLRVTSDGSKCIFRTSATLYRVDTATGTLESSYALDASNDCFGVSPDGSVVAYGFTAARIARWNGSEYKLVDGTAVSGYYGGAAAVAADNSTVYFGFYKNTYMTNRVIRFDLDTGSTTWTYDYPTGSGSYQNVVEWMECSSDGRWMVIGSWGCENGGGAEINVFDDLNPLEPVFSIDSPGSIFHVDISTDGRYITAAGKHVHANEMGSGTDVYMAEIDVMGIEEEASALSLSLYPNPTSGSFSAAINLPDHSSARLSIFDLTGRCRHEETVTAEGSHAVSASLPAGLYVCRVTSATETVSARFAVIH